MARRKQKKTKKSCIPRAKRVREADALAGVRRSRQLFLFCRVQNKKKLAASYSRTGESRTTLGDGELDFCVRNGNRYFFSSMATSKKL